MHNKHVAVNLLSWSIHLQAMRQSVLHCASLHWGPHLGRLPTLPQILIISDGFFEKLVKGRRQVLAFSQQEMAQLMLTVGHLLNVFGVNKLAGKECGFQSPLLKLWHKVKVALAVPFKETLIRLPLTSYMSFHSG